MASDIGGLSWAQFRSLPLDRRQAHLKSVQRLGGTFDASTAPANTLYEVNGTYRTKIPTLSPGLTGTTIRGRHIGVRSRSSFEFDESTEAVQAARGSASGGSTVLGVSQGTFMAVAWSAGTSMAHGVGQSTAEAVGAASGTSTAIGVPQGVTTATGQADGTATVAGVGQGTAAATGQALGTSTAAAVGQGTAAAAGQALGTSTAAGVAQGTVAATGTASGTSNVSGVGLSTNTATGQSLGTSSVEAVGQSTASSVGQASGTSTVAGVAQGTVAATGQASGTSAVAGVGQSTNAATGQSLGTANVAGVGQGTASTVGLASGTSTVAGVGQGTATATGVASGTSTVGGVGQGISTAAGQSSGAATVTGVSQSTSQTTGQSSGSSSTAIFSIAGIGDMVIEHVEPHTVFQVYANADVTSSATGQASGTSTVSGVAQGTAAAAGQASGTSTVSGVALSSTYNMFGTQTPSVPVYDYTQPATFGTRFYSSVAGNVTGVRFYKGSSAGGNSHTVALYTGTGTLLASKATTGETSSGWQTQLFDTPVAITVDTVYCVAVYWPGGYFAYTADFFTSQYEAAPLHAPANSNGGNGRYYLGANLNFPTSSYNENYYSDILLVA